MKHFSEAELKTYAEKVSDSIVIRTYANGNSKDEKRTTTEPEKRLIFSLIFGALLAINAGANSQSVKDCAEYTGDLLIPQMNGYDSIYNVISDFSFEE
jgi:hypothetical protein